MATKLIGHTPEQLFAGFQSWFENPEKIPQLFKSALKEDVILILKETRKGKAVNGSRTTTPKNCITTISHLFQKIVEDGIYLDFTVKKQKDPEYESYAQIEGKGEDEEKNVHSVEIVLSCENTLANRITKIAMKYSITHEAN